VFRRRYPELELRLAVHNREQIVQQLADNQIDLAVMGRPPQDVATEAETFAEHPLTMIAAAEHPLCQKALVEPADLTGETFLIREQGSGTRSAMEQYFAEAGIEPRLSLEMTGNETIKQSVMANMGIAFLSEHAVGLEMSVGRLGRLRMEGLPVMRRWYVVHLKEKRLSPVASAFREFLLSEGAGLIASAVGEGASPA
jgi:LysR family transcriptional regulator, low CO2-responsive transcriptional regulator